MADQVWDKGVELELHGIGKYRTVKSTEDAARQLTSAWPKPEGPAFDNAVKACIVALENTRQKALASKARQAFIDAADDARIYIRDK
jgi:hypothetical protein